MITTIVLFVTIFVLVSGLIVNKLGQKTTAVLGIAIAAVSSIIPAFSNSFNMIMVSRAISVSGLATTSAVSLIANSLRATSGPLGWRPRPPGSGLP